MIKGHSPSSYWANFLWQVLKLTQICTARSSNVGKTIKHLLSAKAPSLCAETLKLGELVAPPLTAPIWRLSTETTDGAFTV